MATQLKFPIDSRSIPVAIVDIPTDVVTGQLAAATDTAVTVPAGVVKALISVSNDVWVSKAVIVLPTAASQSTTADMLLNPTGITVVAAETIHLHARAIADYHVAFYA